MQRAKFLMDRQAHSPAVTTPDPVQIIGESPALRGVLELARRGADSNATILLQGESGTGKARLAAAIHGWSKRAGEPFVSVNCSALAPQTLAEELFGDARHVGWAAGGQMGRVSAATGGTIFLNEIHAAPPVVQVQLLRLLQERQYERIGEREPQTADVRTIAATSWNLQAEVEAGRFREDLWWRLNVIPISVPPLRRRREDIVPLAQHFLRGFAAINQRPVERIGSAALAALQQYPWPGNVRELQNYIERAVVLAEGNELTLELLPGVVSGQQTSEMGAFRGADPQSLIAEIVHNGIATANGDASDLHAQIVNPVERELIVQVMQECNQVQKKAADRLGINRNTLHKKLKEYKIE